MKILENNYQGYLSGLLDGDYPACSRVVLDLLDAGCGLREIYENLFRRSLYDVGSLWERHRISVAKEHLATATTEALMPLVFSRLSSMEHDNKRAIVCCAANEYHQIGGRMVADYFEMKGWRTHFLGANTPVLELLEMVQEKQPDVVALSVSIKTNLPKAEAFVREIRQKQATIPILLGGQAFNISHGGSHSIDRQFPHVEVLHSLDDLDSFTSRQT